MLCSRCGGRSVSLSCGPPFPPPPSQLLFLFLRPTHTKVPSLSLRAEEKAFATFAETTRKGRGTQSDSRRVVRTTCTRRREEGLPKSEYSSSLSGRREGLLHSLLSPLGVGGPPVVIKLAFATSCPLRCPPPSPLPLFEERLPSPSLPPNPPCLGYFSMYLRPLFCRPPPLSHCASLGVTATGLGGGIKLHVEPFRTLIRPKSAPDSGSDSLEF